MISSAVFPAPSFRLAVVMLTPALRATSETPLLVVRGVGLGMGVFTYGVCVQYFSENMEHFGSANAYWRFEISVKTGFRHALEDHAKRFLDGLLATCEQRAEKLR